MACKHGFPAPNEMSWRGPKPPRCLECRIEELEAEVERLAIYKTAIEDIAEDPVIIEHLQMKRGVVDILAIARAAIDAAMEK